MKHGVYVAEQATSVSTPVVAASGVPFVVGLAPVHMAKTPAAPGVPVLCNSWAEAVEKLGYSEDWKKFTLCEFMYSHFKLYGCQPVIFCNVLDIGTMKEAEVAADSKVFDHKVLLPVDAINSAALVVKASGGTGNAYVKDTDYAVYYTADNLVIELLPDGAGYDAQNINVAYDKVNTKAVTASGIAAAIESVELCATAIGTVPDLICAPGFSHNTAVAAAMATKAGNINGLFSAKAMIDIDCGTSGARAYSEVLSKKKAANMSDADEIVCWPQAKLDGHRFHLSTLFAGLMAQVDSNNGGVPYESPSNKRLQCDGLCLEDGTEVNLTLAQGNELNANGVVTALNFMGGWTAWGNYTGCYPDNSDVKDYFIPVGRVFSWVGNSLVKTFWSNLDKPMSRRLVDTILDSANIWLNGLVGSGYLLGARVEMLEEENPLSNLAAGVVKLHIYMTPPSPAQEIDFVLEYDASYVTAALQA